MTNIFTKDPDAVLDFQWDWSVWMNEGDAIDSFTIDVPDGLTLDSSSNTSDSVTAWLSGGTLEEGYQVICHIVTTDGREDDRSIYIKCQSR